MPRYLAVYVNNRVVSVREIEFKSEEKVDVTPGGLLIYAVVEAGSAKEAEEKARQITVAHLNK